MKEVKYNSLSLFHDMEQDGKETEMSDVNSMVQGWLSGAKTADEVTGQDSSAGPGTRVVGGHGDEEEGIFRAENSTVDDLMPRDNGEDAPADSQETEDSEASPSEAKSAGKPETSGTKEVITITDDKGRRKVEVDFSNKDKLKQYVQMAYGARKWQAERDQARTEKQQLQEKHSELSSNWEVLNKVYSDSGVEGLVDLLEGRKGAYQDSVKKAIDRDNFYKKASPEEIEVLEARELAHKSAREMEKIRKENEDFRKQMTEKEEKAELASLESRVHPIFDKYRFADKLGSADDEQMFDEMLWNSALKRLEPYEEKNVAITPELVEREFRSVATALRKRINVQAEKRATKVIDQKKQEATENVQTKVKSGYSQGGSAKEAEKLINSNNLTDLLKGWGKYGSLFQNKK